MILPEKCSATVYETVCVQADVTITPHVDVKEIKTKCVDDVVLEPCDGSLQETCTFSVSQNICVEVPLDFYATAVAVPKGIVCGEVSKTPC